MKIEELVDNYLISSGCGISPDCAYIAEDKYDYQEKEKERKLDVSGNKLLLSRCVKNTLHLDSVVMEASYNFTNYIKGVIERKANQNTLNDSDVSDLCEYVDTALKVYFTDYIKYVREKLTLTEPIFTNLVNLIDANVNSTKSSINSLLQKNNMKMLEAVSKAAADRSSSEAQVLAEIANAPKTTLSTSYVAPGLIYDKLYTSSSTGSAMSNTKLVGGLQGSSMFGSQMENVYKTSGNYSSILEMAEIVDKIVEKFNKDLKEILIVKYNELFNKDVYNNTKSLEKNPLYIDGYTQLTDNLSTDDIKNIKEVFEYYEIDLTPILDQILSTKVYDDYIKTKACNYNNPLASLYSDVSGDKELKLSNLQTPLYDYFIKMADSKEKKYNEKYEDVLKEVDDCIYLTDETKNNIKRNINKEAKKIDEEYDYYIEKLSISALSIGLWIILTIAIVILYKVLPHNDELYTMPLGIGIILDIIWIVCIFKNGRIGDLFYSIKVIRENKKKNK